jgi:hypothetical protein
LRQGIYRQKGARATRILFVILAAVVMIASFVPLGLAFRVMRRQEDAGGFRKRIIWAFIAPVIGGAVITGLGFLML